MRLLVKTNEEVLARLRKIEAKIDRLETFSHGARATYVGDNRVLMKCVVENHQIAFLVEADDRLITTWFIVSGTYETDLTNLFVEMLHQDSHRIDIGANFGYFTCLMARFSPRGKLIGVEPDRHVYEIARDLPPAQRLDDDLPDALARQPLGLGDLLVRAPLAQPLRDPPAPRQPIARGAPGLERGLGGERFGHDVALGLRAPVCA
jgi:hypothetical protein